MKSSFYAVALLCAIAITSCKTGPDDPAISLRSRDKKVTGVWTLKSSTVEVNGNVTSLQTNDATTDNGQHNTTIANTHTFDAGTLTIAENKTVVNNTTKNGVKSTNPNGTSTLSKKYKISDASITLYDDHTYAVSYGYELMQNKYCFKFNRDSTWHDSCQDNKIDIGEKTVYSNDFEGVWAWNAEGKDSKMEVVLEPNMVKAGEKTKDGLKVGPLGNVFKGHITRLSNSELVITSSSNETGESVDFKTGKLLVGVQYVDAKFTTAVDSSFQITSTETWEKTENKPSKE